MLYQSKKIHEVAAVAGKDGYLHAIDRDTHKALFKTAVTTQLKTAAKATKEGAKTCPGFIGGTQWNGPAYDVDNHLILVGAVDWCTIHKLTGPDYERGQLRFGGTPIPVNDPPPSGWITAVDAETGVVKWKYHTEAPVVAAVTPTAGGVTFTGDTAGNFLIFETASGKLLSSRKLDGALGGGIITYAAKGKQYVATTTGNVSRITFGGPGKPSIVVWGL
jgi:alcohol dehydrogenase (cytochrome c)